MGEVKAPLIAKALGGQTKHEARMGFGPKKLLLLLFSFLFIFIKDFQKNAIWALIDWLENFIEDLEKITFILEKLGHGLYKTLKIRPFFIFQLLTSQKP